MSTFTITIDLRAAAAAAGLNQLTLAMENSLGIHEAMAAGVEMTVGEHLRGLNSRSPNTDFYAAAARGVETEADDRRALVRVPKLGFALRYHGGTVEPGKSISSHTGELTRALAIPTDRVPVVGPPDGRHRQRPRDAGLLAFVPARNKDHTIGYLVQGEEKVATRGPRKGQTRVVPLAGGALLYVLTDQASHDPDPGVLPDGAVLAESAASAAADYLESFTDDQP